MNFFEQFLINAVAGVLRTFVKNPRSAAAYENVLQHISDDLAVILGGLKPPTP